MGSCKSAVSCEAGQRVLARVIPLRRYMEDDQKLQQDRGSAHLSLGRLPLCGTGGSEGVAGVCRRVSLLGGDSSTDGYL